MDYYAKTDIGKIRKNNQDQATVVANKSDQILLVVCDGLGGHKAGEVASRVAIDYVVNCFKIVPSFEEDGSEIKKWMNDVIIEADKIIKRNASTANEQEGMATTIVLAILIKDKLYVSHVGDSRLYIVGKKSIKQITKDHNLVNALLDQGAINEEEALNHSKKNVLLQSLGAQGELSPSYTTLKMKNNFALLCSDGLYNAVDDKTIVQIINKNTSINNKVYELIKTANDNGGPDNIAIAIVKV